MADSLVLAGQLELLGAEGGVPSQIPACLGAVFLLAPDYDLNAPQTTVELLAAGLLDGERPIGRRSSNRTVTLPIKITAPDRDTLANAREVLLGLVDEDSWQLTWTRDGGQPMVLDCFRAAPAVPGNDLLAERQLVSYVTVSFAALPYGRSDVAEVLEFPVPTQVWNQPSTPVAIDIFGTATNFLAGITDAAGFEGGTAGGWVAAGNMVAPVSVNTVAGHGGSRELLLRSVAAGNMQAAHTAAGNYATAMFGVRPGTTVTISAWFRSAVSTRSANVGLDFYDANGTVVGSTVRGSNITTTTTGWTQATGSITVPSGAAWAALNAQVLATGGASEDHYLDDASIDNGAVYSYDSPPQWSLSNLTPVSGHHSAKWARLTQDNPIYDHLLPAALDITGRFKLTFWLGLSTTAAQWRVWHKGTVHFAVSLTDTSGQVLNFSGKQVCRAGAVDAGPHWQLINLHIPQLSAGFNYAALARYKISIWNAWDSTLRQPGALTAGQQVLQVGAYLGDVTATATATGVAATRGIFVTMPGIIGSARAPLAIQAAPGPSAFSTSVEFNTAGSNPWTAPVGVTQVDKAETWGAGGGGAGRRSGGGTGGGGGGGGGYTRRDKVPVTAGNSYPATVGAGGTPGSAGNPGNPGGDSFWAGNSGGQVRAFGGSPGWQSATWGGSKGAPAADDQVAYPGGNGKQSNADGQGFGGGGGSSAGTGAGGNHPDTGGRQGASPPTGGGPGGDGGRTTGGSIDGQSPPAGPGGGGGGGADQPGGDGAAGANGRVRLTYGATGILPLQSLLVHVPDRDQPPSYQPLVPVGNGADLPNGATSYPVPAVGALAARFDGTYTCYLIASSWNNPSAARTVTVTFTQTAYGGGPTATVALTRTLVPNTDVLNGYVDLGAVTLPVNALPAGNLSATFSVTVSDTNTADRFQDLLVLSATGQTLLVNVAGSSVFNNIWVDPPDANHALGLVSGSNTDRDQAYSVAASIERYSGGPLAVEPGTVNRLLVYAQQGVPGFTATYLPAWWMDRMALAPGTGS